MKQRISLFLLLSALVSLASCTKEIKFKGEQTEPKLVLYSVAQAGKPLEVQISQSVFFLDAGMLDDYAKSLRPEEGSVKLYVNDSALPYVLTRRIPQPVDLDGDGNPDTMDLPEAPLYYDAAYVPVAGDRLRLVASFPGFDEASAEVQLPLCSSLTVNSASARPVGDETLNYRYYDLTLTVKRGADPQCYYGIRPYIAVSYIYQGEPIQHTFSWDIESDDFLFQGNGGTTDQISQLFSDDNVSMLFADTKIPSDTYTFRCSFQAYNLDILRTEGGTAECYLVFTTMTRDLYFYRTSMAALNGSSSFSLFSEATGIYSNVKGGYGCFCASSSLKIALDL